MGMLLFAGALSAFAIAFCMTIAYFLAPEFPGGPAGAWAIGGVAAFFGAGGVLGGFIGGWYIGKEKGPLAIHELGTKEIEFPHMKITLNRDDILGMDYVRAGYWRDGGSGRSGERLCQMFCRVRDGEQAKHVIVHSDCINLFKRWRAFAREVGLEVKEHKVPWSQWPRLD